VKIDVRSLVSPALDRARGRLGQRDINWTPDFMGFGNQLYLWCWAHDRRFDAQEPKVLINERTRPWLPEVPGFAREFLLERDDVSLWDRRGHYWAEKEKISGYPQGFSPDARTAFVERLAQEPLLAGVGHTDLAGPDVLTVNVRRGDYYSVAAHRSWFAIDLASYLDRAIRGSVDRDGPVARIHLVSDDPRWCLEHVPGLKACAAELTVSPAGDPAQHFRDVCGSRRLVVSNSTFSIWGAFISRTLIEQDPGMIWAPAFFQSTYGEGRCFEYDQDFSFVNELPDGWQPDWVLSGAESPGPPGSTRAGGALG